MLRCLYSSLTILLLLSPVNSLALIVSANDPILGANKITRDTTTGFDWLDLDLTSNLSWNEAETTFSALGFRHATLSEVETFFTNAGIPVIDTGTSAANYSPSLNLQELIGGFSGFNVTTGSVTFGSFGWTAIDGGFSELSWIDRNDTKLEATVIVNSNNIIGGTPDVFDTFSHPTRSHWMLRPVPLPASVWLLLSALAFIGWKRVSFT